MKLNNESLKDTAFWEKAGISLPRFDRKKMIAATKEFPKWVHFGAGNIFRAFPAALMQYLLDEGLETTGIVVAEGYDGEIKDKAFTAFDNLTICVTLKSDGTTEKKVIASVAHSIRMDTELIFLKEAFSSPSMQMASFTITEKGYSIKGKDGNYLPEIEEDLKIGPVLPSLKSYLGRIASLLHERYIREALPVTMVSMDNCSHNGDILFAAMEAIAEGWVKNRKADSGFLDYIRDKSKVAFPWSMIDKITPRPDESVRKMLTACGLENMEGVVTKKNTYIAPFVNAEETQYLIIEDCFTNGKPALEKAGVIFTNRETVDRVERMKVCTCLNPLHTALAIFGCLLGYTRINEEMKNPALVKLIEGIGYDEGLPVVTDPGIIKPREFIDQVIKVRLPNPFMPDAPQRIAMDTSLKIPIRFGETIKEYIKTGKNIGNLKFIPLVLAGWLRYLLGVDNQGEPFEVSPDPQYENLKSALSGISLGQDGPFHDKLEPILSNPVFFGVNLYKAGSSPSIGEKVEKFFEEMLEGPGAVRKKLENSTGIG